MVGRRDVHSLVRELKALACGGRAGMWEDIDEQKPARSTGAETAMGEGKKNDIVVSNKNKNKEKGKKSNKPAHTQAQKYTAKINSLLPGRRGRGSGGVAAAGEFPRFVPNHFDNDHSDQECSDDRDNHSDKTAVVLGASTSSSFTFTSCGTTECEPENPSAIGSTAVMHPTPISAPNAPVYISESDPYSDDDATASSIVSDNNHNRTHRKISSAAPSFLTPGKKKANAKTKAKAKRLKSGAEETARETARVTADSERARDEIEAEGVHVRDMATGYDTCLMDDV